MLKFALLLVMLHALPETHSSKAQTARAQMLLTAPAHIRAIRGTCLVIPCSFSLPNNFPGVSTYNGLWKKGTEHVIVAQSNRKLPHQDYRGRSYFRGLIHNRNCTLLLWNVRDSDAGLYFFRLEMPGYDSCSWRHQPTEVQVVGEYEPVVEVEYGGARGDVLAHCSVIYNCPYSRPYFTWNTKGSIMVWSRWMDDWQWMAYSILHFRPQQNTTLKPRCTVTH